MNRLLLRGAQIITMAPHRPDTEPADILTDGDTITAVGEGLVRAQLHESADHLIPHRTG